MISLRNAILADPFLGGKEVRSKESVGYESEEI
jgi:hypothetical protein